MPNPQPCNMRTTINIATATAPAASAPPTSASTAAMAKAPFRPNRSARKLCKMAPNAAPNANKAFTAPSIFAVSM